jgi:hypothetical protein
MRNTWRLLSVSLAFAALAACYGAERQDGTSSSGSPTGSLSACRVQTILQDRCGSCHGAVLQNGAPVGLTSLSGLRAVSAAHPGETVASRCIARMADDAAPMPPAPAERAPHADLETLRKWVSEGMPECADAGTVDPTSEESPNQIPQAELFACNPSVDSSSPGRLRRIGRDEWRYAMPNSIANDAWASVNPFDANSSDFFSTYASDETVDDAVLDLYLGPGLAGERVGQEVALHLERLKSVDTQLTCMFANAKPAAACVNYFVTQLLERLVLFRPASTTEIGHLQTFADAVLRQETNVSGRAASIARIANVAWLSSGALFRSERGVPAPGATATLSNWELAQSMALALTDHAPGGPGQYYRDTAAVSNQYGHTAPLAGHLASFALAARDGSIQSDATRDVLLRSVVGGTDPERMDVVAELPRGDVRQARGEYWLSIKLSGFFREWLGYDAASTVFKDQPALTSRFQPSGKEIESISRSYRTTLQDAAGKQIFGALNQNSWASFPERGLKPPALLLCKPHLSHAIRRAA